MLMLESKWLICPVCNNKTRTKIREDTVLENFPLFCARCKNETIITVRHLDTAIIKELDANIQNG